MIFSEIKSIIVRFYHEFPTFREVYSPFPTPLLSGRNFHCYTVPHWFATLHKVRSTPFSAKWGLLLYKFHMGFKLLEFEIYVKLKLKIGNPCGTVR